MVHQDDGDYSHDNYHYLAALCYDYVRQIRSDPVNHLQSVGCYTTSSCLDRTKSSFYRTLGWLRIYHRQASVGQPTTEPIRADRRRGFLFYFRLDHDLVFCIHLRAVKKSHDSRRRVVLFWFCNHLVRDVDRARDFYPCDLAGIYPDLDFYPYACPQGFDCDLESALFLLCLPLSSVFSWVQEVEEHFDLCTKW